LCWRGLAGPFPGVPPVVAGPFPGVPPVVAGPFPRLRPVVAGLVVTLSAHAAVAAI
jgi:hypothetical protein